LFKEETVARSLFLVFIFLI